MYFNNFLCYSKILLNQVGFIMSGFKDLTSKIFSDLLERFPSQRLTQRRKLSELVSAALTCQSPNLMEISAVLDRPTESAEARYNYVERFMKNDLVEVDKVMETYAKDLLERLTKHQHTLVLMIDQSKINDKIQMLMISVRLKKRAVPIFWCAAQTQGAIGFDRQKELLEIVKNWLPEGQKIMLAGDRFYGTSMLINWCQEQKWGYRIRLKGGLYSYQNEGEDKTLNQIKSSGINSIEKSRLRCGAVTNIGILHEKGHKEAWFIAMDCKPTEYATRDYGLRWGIESMFSDFKSRGFRLSDSKIQISDRMERLVLVLSIALHWAVSIGLWHKKQHEDHAEKRGAKKQKDPVLLFLNVAFASSGDVFRWIKPCQLYGLIQTDGW
jgi:hypothetical protein